MEPRRGGEETGRGGDRMNDPNMADLLRAMQEQHLILLIFMVIAAVTILTCCGRKEKKVKGK